MIDTKRNISQTGITAPPNQPNKDRNQSKTEKGGLFCGVFSKIRGKKGKNERQVCWESGINKRISFKNERNCQMANSIYIAVGMGWAGQYLSYARKKININVYFL